MSNNDNIVIAVAQFDVKMFEKKSNLAKMAELARTAKNEYNPDLMIFPECANCGYNFSSEQEMIEVSEPMDGESVQFMKQLAVELGFTIVFGFVERAGDKYYNCAVMLETDGSLQFYRKAHLPFLGVDKYVSKGEEIRTIQTHVGTVGMMICYDLRFPEVARELSLCGARILILPTNLPRGGEAHPNVFTRARACENRVFVVSSNRVGEERGFCYIGRSQIVAPDGEILGEMGENEGIMAVSIDLCLAQEKDIVVIPGEYETHIFDDRRPELYRTIGI